MYSPTIICGNINENKSSDLSNYLKTLKKKQSEINAKHGKTKEKTPEAEEDSDLASLAREFKDDILAESRFLKKKGPSTPSSACSLLEEKIPFISSKLSSKQNFKAPQNSNALENFMKFDLKYTDLSNKLKNDEQLSEFTEPTSSEEVQNKLLRKSLREKIVEIITTPEGLKDGELNQNYDNEDLSSTSSRFVSLLKKRAGKSDLRLNISKCTDADIESHGLDTLSHITNIVSPIHVIEEFDEDEIKEESIATEEEDKSSKTEEIVEVISIIESSVIDIKSATDDVEQSSSKEIKLKSVKSPNQSHSPSERFKKKKVKSSSSSKQSSNSQDTFHNEELLKRKNARRSKKSKKTQTKFEERKELKPRIREPNYVHYLFDPSLDLNYYNPGDEIRLSDMYIDSADYVLNDMLRSQLDLTKNFLDSQRLLYLNYCQSLENMVKAFNSKASIHERDVKPRKKNLSSVSFASSRSSSKETSVSGQEASSKTLVSYQEEEEDEEESYESDFQTDTGSTVKNIIT